MSAPRDAERVLADVEHAIRVRIRIHARYARYWKRVVPGDDARRGLAAHRMTIRALLAVRRAARGGRDGGGE